MLSRPKISVITVVRNDVSHIESTIKSVISQNYDNLEYIVIDGCSSDGTVDIIRKYKESIDVFISEPDSGIYDAMNKGVRCISGEWVSFINSGDGFFTSSIVNDVFQSYCDNGEALIYGDFYLINQKGHQDRVIKAVAEVSKKIEVAPSCHQAIFTRSIELRNHPFDTKYRLIADFAFFYDLYSRNSNRYYSNSIICYYDYTGVSSTSRKSIMLERARFYFSRGQIGKAIWFYIVYVKRLLTH